MESHQNKIISVENITVDFGNFRALDNVNAEINAGDFVAITGPNGGGKSTLLKTMLHLLTPTKGRVRYFNGDEEVDGLRFGYLPQKSNIDNRFPITVEEVVASGLLGERRNWRGKFSDAASEKIEATMKMMGVDGFRRQVIGTLSGGQLQRTLLGRAVISNPDIVVLDEPLSYVDHAFVEQIYGIVWKESYFGDYNIVMSHIRNIREKIEDNPSKPVYVQTVWGVGYRFNQKML